jgi:hypothetical protein
MPYAKSMFGSDYSEPVILWPEKNAIRTWRDGFNPQSTVGVLIDIM